jgi:hypothetical protein
MNRQEIKHGGTYPIRVDEDAPHGRCWSCDAALDETGYCPIGKAQDAEIAKRLKAYFAQEMTNEHGKATFGL